MAHNIVHKKAVCDGTPLDPEVFKNATILADFQMRKLLSDFNDQVAEFTKTVPNVHVLYPQLQLGPKPTPKPALQASQEPNAKRAKTALNQDVSAQKSLTPDVRELQKLVGFLTYAKVGVNAPDFNIFYADNKGVSNCLCMNGTTRGCFCCYGTNCANHHPKKFTDIPETECRVLIKNVEKLTASNLPPVLALLVRSELTIKFSCLSDIFTSLSSSLLAICFSQ